MKKSLFDLTGKTAVVTGGAGLLGRTFVRALAESGAKVYAADIDLIQAEDHCSALRKKKLDAIAVQLDIANELSVQECLKKVILESGRIDVWINNAYPRTKDWGSVFEKVSFDSWRENVDRHMNGYCLCCQKVAEQMKKQKGGSIINMASIYGIVGPDFSIYEGTDLTMPAAYSAIKGGIVNFTKYLASYYGPSGVRINTVSPGGVLDEQPETFVKKYSSKTPLRRMAKVDDITGAIIYLASEASSYITGHNLVVDGGWSAI